jgi:6,7-dimethyl-8-ribityllumazine synthase
MSLDAPAQTPLDGSQFSLGVVAARFNGELVDGLLRELMATWARHGVPAARVELVRVPGSHEVPVAVQLLADAGRHDCLVALGVLVGGETRHHEMVGTSVSHALQTIALASRIPVINGVVVADTRAQAEARCTGKINRGTEFARAALEMGAVRRKLHP